MSEFPQVWDARNKTSLSSVSVDGVLGKLKDSAEQRHVRHSEPPSSSALVPRNHKLGAQRQPNLARFSGSAIRKVNRASISKEGPMLESLEEQMQLVLRKFPKEFENIFHHGALMPLLRFIGANLIPYRVKGRRTKAKWERLASSTQDDVTFLQFEHLFWAGIPTGQIHGRRVNMKSLKTVVKRIGVSLYGWNKSMIGVGTTVFNKSGRIPGFRWSDFAWPQAKTIRFTGLEGRREKYHVKKAFNGPSPAELFNVLSHPESSGVVVTLSLPYNMSFERYVKKFSYTPPRVECILSAAPPPLASLVPDKSFHGLRFIPDSKFFDPAGYQISFDLATNPTSLTRIDSYPNCVVWIGQNETLPAPKPGGNAIQTHFGKIHVSKNLLDGNGGDFPMATGAMKDPIDCTSDVQAAGQHRSPSRVSDFTSTSAILPSLDNTGESDLDDDFEVPTFDNLAL